MFRFLYFFLITKCPFLGNSKKCMRWRKCDEVLRCRCAVWHVPKEQCHRGTSPRKWNNIETGLVKFLSGWHCFVTGSVRDENSMWIPRKQHRMESGFTMCQTGWQHLVACGSHLSDGKGMSCACFSPAAHRRGVSRRPQPKHVSSNFSVWPAVAAFFLFFLKFDSFSYLSWGAEHKTEIKEVCRGEGKMTMDSCNT